MLGTFVDVEGGKKPAASVTLPAVGCHASLILMGSSDGCIELLQRPAVLMRLLRQLMRWALSLVEQEDRRRVGPTSSQMTSTVVAIQVPSATAGKAAFAA